MSPSKGQKLTDKPKDFLLQVRLDQDTKKDLDECAQKLQVSRSDVVRQGIALVKKSI